MKKNITKENALLLLLGGIFLGLCLILLVSQQRQVTALNTYKHQTESAFLQIAGACADQEDLLYTVIDSMKLNIEPEAVARGQEVLAKYGYLNNISPFYQIMHRNYIRADIYTYMTLLLLPIAFFCITFLILRKKFFYELEEFSLILGRMMDNNFDYHVSVYKSGVKYKILWQLEQLSKAVRFSQERLKSEKENTKALVTDISHQLKTPLASLTICHAIIEDEDTACEERSEFLQMGKLQIQKLDELIDSLVKISHMEAGMIRLKAASSSISDTIIQAVNTVYMKAESKNIHLDLQIREDDQIPHDPKWTGEALANVLDNAVKYSPENTCITVISHIMRGFYRIEIRDEGIGISKKHLPDIYKRFYRGSHELVKQTEGSGVGLFLTRKILEQQGASIRAAANAGRGTTFVIQIPRTRITT